MGELIKLILSALVGYLLGSINSSVIAGKFYGIDIRKHGSGNAGATNALRTLGKKAALFVLVGDVLKGIISCMIGSYIAGYTGIIIAGAAAIIGHTWPLYFNFKGGKGVLTSEAIIFFIDWKLALITLGIFIVIVVLTKYVSLGSIIGAVSLPFLAIIFRRNIEFIIFAVVIGALVVIRHQANIKRLLNGTESKIKQKVGGV